MRCGYEGLLEISDTREESLRAVRIELGQYVIEQQQGRLAGPFVHDAIFGDLERKYRRALLPLRSVGGKRTSVKQELEIVAMRTRPRSFCRSRS